MLAQNLSQNRDLPLEYFNTAHGIMRGVEGRVPLLSWASVPLVHETVIVPPIGAGNVCG